MDEKETSVGYIVGDKYVSVSTDERKYINKILKYKENYPDDVVIVYQNKDGSITANLPQKWFKFPSPPKSMSEENKQKVAQRMRDMWSNK